MKYMVYLDFVGRIEAGNAVEAKEKAARSRWAKYRKEQAGKGGGK